MAWEDSRVREEQFLGMTVTVPGNLRHPLCVGMIIKGLDDDGDIAYWGTATDDVTTVEMLGMFRWGMHRCLTADDEDED